MRQTNCNNCDLRSKENRCSIQQNRAENAFLNKYSYDTFILKILYSKTPRVTHIIFTWNLNILKMLCGIWKTSVIIINITEYFAQLSPETKKQKAKWQVKNVQLHTRACSIRRQKRIALPTSLRLWNTSVFSSAYSMISLSWWWKNSRIPEKHIPHSK